MSEPVRSSRPKPGIKELAIIAVLIIVVWLAIKFLIAAVKTIVLIVAVLCIIWFVVRFLTGGKS
jgi:hypothetical protein